MKLELSQYSLKIKHFLLDYKLNYDQLVIHFFWIAVILRFLWLEFPNDWYMGDEQHFVRAI